MLSKETRQHVDEGRMAALPVTPQFIEEFDIPENRWFEVDNPLPDDAEIVGMAFDPMCRVFLLYVASATFERVPIGERLPLLPEPTFTVTEEANLSQIPLTIHKMEAFFKKVMGDPVFAKNKIRDCVIWPASIKLERTSNQ